MIAPALCDFESYGGDLISADVYARGFWARNRAKAVMAQELDYGVFKEGNISADANV